MRRAAAAWAVLALGLSSGAPSVQAAGPPQLGAAWTSGVGEAAATLNAEVNPNGLATTYHFDYLTEATYAANVATGKEGFAGALRAPADADLSLGASTTLLAVARTIASLASDRDYRYRLVAANAAGTAAGPGRPFRTLPLASATFLLDSRAFELVSPLEKGGGEIQAPGTVLGGGAFQAAAGGGALTYSSTYSFGAEAKGAPPASQYTSTRGAAGWVSANISAPTATGAYGEEPDGAPYQLFSPDLTRAAMLEGAGCAPTGPCPRAYSLRGGAGEALAFSAQAPDLRFAGSSPDLSQRILSTCAALTPNATEAPGPDGCDPTQPNLYRWSSAGLSLVNLLPAASLGTPGAALAAPAGAVSADGGRVYFTLGGNLYLREGAQTKQVDLSLGGGGSFQSASVDGSLGFFTKAGHLYRYQTASSTVTDLTPSGEVLGVLGASADGAYLYYQTATGLYLRHGENAAVKIADGPGAAAPGNYPPATGSARLSAAGTHLAFLSTAPLSGYDNRGALLGSPPSQAGVPQSQVFLYDAGAGTLTCVSCNPSGERPLGPSSVPGAAANGQGPWAVRAYKPRSLSDDGRRLFFDSADDLALRDRDRSPQRPDPDVYEWEAQGKGSCTRPGGCLALISSGRSAAGASFVDASASGADVFFLTADSLLSSDGGFVDLYDAREGGGFPESAEPIECLGDACQFLPSEPEDPAPSTLSGSPGNGPLRIARAKLACGKRFVKKRDRCVKKPGHPKKKRVKKGARR